jgi:hypothetical protein
MSAHRRKLAANYIIGPFRKNHTEPGERDREILESKRLSSVELFIAVA